MLYIDTQHYLSKGGKEIIKCKYCKFRICVESKTRFTHKEYYCGWEYERCDPYEMTRNANDPNYFCGDAVKKEV